ncbi:hypothetical protein MC885_011131, partial [Smutsia gigantea]
RAQRRRPGRRRHSCRPGSGGTDRAAGRGSEPPTPAAAGRGQAPAAAAAAMRAGEMGRRGEERGAGEAPALGRGARGGLQEGGARSGSQRTGRGGELCEGGAGEARGGARRGRGGGEAGARRGRGGGEAGAGAAGEAAPTGAARIPAAEGSEEHGGDEVGPKERSRGEAPTQQSATRNDAVSVWDPGRPCLFQAPSGVLSGRYESAATASEEGISGGVPEQREVQQVQQGCKRFSTLEREIEDLEKEVVRERQEDLRLVRLMQDEEEMIGKLKEEIDFLNRDLDDIEDENEQLKQENKTLWKLVGQLT